MLAILRRRCALSLAERGHRRLDRDPRAALGDFERALRLTGGTSPDDLLALSGRSAALALLDRLEEAGADIDRQLAIVADPGVSAELRLAAWRNRADWCDATDRLAGEAEAWGRIADIPGADRTEALLRSAIALRWLGEATAAGEIASGLPASEARDLLLARLAAERGDWQTAADLTARYTDPVAGARHAIARHALGLPATLPDPGDDVWARLHGALAAARILPEEAERRLTEAVGLPAAGPAAIEVRVALARVTGRPDPALAKRIAERWRPDHPFVRVLTDPRGAEAGAPWATGRTPPAGS